MALTLVLLVGAGLLLRTIRQMWEANPGFEIRNLEQFVKLAESAGAKMDRGYVKAAQYGDLGIAFLTDPWGTYIELNEGLTSVR